MDPFPVIAVVSLLIGATAASLRRVRSIVFWVGASATASLALAAWAILVKPHSSFVLAQEAILMGAVPVLVAFAVARYLDEGMWIAAAGSASLAWLAGLLAGFIVVVAVNGL